MQHIYTAKMTAPVQTALQKAAEALALAAIDETKANTIAFSRESVAELKRLHALSLCKGSPSGGGTHTSLPLEGDFFIVRGSMRQRASP
jgi:hypothetical protein